MRNTNNMLLYLILINSLWVLTLVSTSLMTIWFLMCSQEPRVERRPQFNLKEL
jgi:hypothetical protein